MEPRKKVAIIHRDESLINTLAEMTQPSYSVSTMLVNKKTLPIQVSSFVDKVAPNLVLLAENYQSILSANQEIRPSEIKLGDGIEALIEIRKSHPKDQLPVFMVSGGVYTQHERAMESGANGYLPMPIGLKEYEEFLKSNLQS